MILYFGLSLVKSDGTVFHTRSRKKRRIIFKTRQFGGENIEINVRYYTDDRALIGNNLGVYSSVEDALAALDAFTEPELLAYLGEP